MDVFLNKTRQKFSKEELTAYVNGMLTCLALVNDDFNTGNTFYFSSIGDNSRTYQEAIIGHLSVPEWEAGLEEVIDFEKVLGQAIEEFGMGYFYWIVQAYQNPVALNVERIAEIKQQSNIHQIKELILKTLDLLLAKQTKVFSIEIVGEGWYEASYKDFFFDSAGEYYYLHLGVSD